MFGKNSSSRDAEAAALTTATTQAMLAGARLRLVDICFYSLYASGVLVFPLFIIRINAIGWNLAAYVHFVVIPLGTVLLFFYKKFSLRMRSLMLIFFALVSALGALTTYGIVGSGFYGMAMMACVIAAIALGRTTGLVTLVISVVMFLVVMFAVFGGHFDLAPNLHDYAFLPSGWATSLVGHILYSMMLIMGIRGMHTLLGELIAGKVENAREIGRQNAFLESIFHSTEAILVVTDAAGRITRGNRAFLDACRLTEAEVIGFPFVESLFPAERHRAAAACFTGNSGGGTREDPWVTGDGGTIEVNWSASPIRDESGAATHWIINGMDMTEQHRLERSFQQAQKLQSVGQLAGGVAHDFNNMLTAILGAAELAAADDLSGESRKYLGVIFETGQKAADLTRKLLGFSRVESGPTEILDLNVAIRDAIHLLAVGVAGDIGIERQLAPEPLLVRGEASQVMNAILNLGLNARDAMPEGGEIVISSRVRWLDAAAVAAMPLRVKPGVYAEVTVADSGIGIPAENLEKVFDPFFSTKERDKGTGLGLPSVYGTMQRHQGALLIESAPGRGTVVRLYFPLLTGEGPTRVAPSLTAGARRLSILLVEDEEAIRFTTSHLLEYCGHRVTTARHGGEALDALQAEGAVFDLVMLDWVMPVMGGRETLDLLLSRNRLLPVIITSGFAPESHRIDEVLEDGHVFFLSKPYQREELLRLLANIFPDRE